MRHTSLKWLNGISSTLTRITTRRSALIVAVLIISALLAVGSVLAFAAFGLGSGAYHRLAASVSEEARATSAPRHRSRSTTPATGRVVTMISSELITIRPSGFEPGELTRAPGPVFLRIENRSGCGLVVLRLDREADLLAPASRLFDEHVPISKLDLSKVVQLIPGRYVLTEVEHPDWSCRITVAEK